MKKRPMDTLLLWHKYKKQELGSSIFVTLFEIKTYYYSVVVQLTGARASSWMLEINHNLVYQLFATSLTCLCCRIYMCVNNARVEQRKDYHLPHGPCATCLLDCVRNYCTLITSTSGKSLPLQACSSAVEPATEIVSRQHIQLCLEHFTGVCSTRSSIPRATTQSHSNVRTRFCPASDVQATVCGKLTRRKEERKK